MSTRQEKLKQKQKTKSKTTDPAKRRKTVSNKYDPSDEDRAKVEMASVIGLPHKKIAELLLISENTLKKYYGHELDNSKNDKNIQIADTLFQKAINGCTASLIFWCKTRMGWKETEVKEVITPVLRVYNRGKADNDK